VFAPGAGRPLAVGGVLLLAGAVVVGLGWVPFALLAVGVLLVGTGVWAFFAWFFRDPERPVGEGIVSAADGTVRAVELEGTRTRVSVFMGVTDVHVNRMPLDGTFVRVETAGAGYRPAYRPDAGQNVARTYDLTTEYGPVEVVQVTGILARRLVSFVRPGERRRRGERFGMIVLGSRVDVLLPTSTLEAVVRPGDRVRAGSSTIARVRP
jgi:phosphatidylserine decarboxylase